MSAKRILIESHNLTLRGGTGIATYARNLAALARAQGFATAGLFGVDVPLSRTNPMMNEIRIFETRRPKRRPLTKVVRDFGAAIVCDPFGARPVKLTRSGFVVDPGSSLFSNAFDDTYAMTEMTDRSRRHFLRYGKLMPFSLDTPPDLFHATHPIPLTVRGAPTICTIHDIVPLRLPYTTLDNKRYFYRLIRKIVEKADHIVTVSEHSKQDLVRFFGLDEKRITNTYQAVLLPTELATRPADEVAGDLAHSFGLDYGEYFLFVGAIEPKKNLGTLIEAYAASGSTRPLVIVGGLGWQYEADVKRINDERFLTYSFDGARITPERRVRHLDYVSGRNLIALMRGARALLFPSIYEGFGLPVLEAMHLGTPVMTSDRSSLPEIAGDAALLVDPYDSAAMARAIRRLDSDDDLCAELAARGPVQAETFSPARYAERLATLYRSLT